MTRNFKHVKIITMKIFYSPDHIYHAPKAELHRGAMVSPHEGPHRMEMLMAGMKKQGFTDFQTAPSCDLNDITAIHSAEYIDFLQTAWARWSAAGYSGDVLPMSYPYNQRRASPPKDIDGAAGYFCTSSDTVVTQTSWRALKSIADITVGAVQSITTSRNTGESAFILSRPPGHHAGANYMSGYCLLNFTAIAAQALQNNGVARTAILDVDFHHGNGTQDIFYARDDVLFTSIHGEPDYHFPYFWGHKDEVGQGKGEGFNVNYPLPAGSTYEIWRAALTDALSKIKKFGAQALIVSLGVDTYEHDPISSFKLKQPDYHDYGAAIATLGLPTIFIMEGGYGVPEIGSNTANVIQGFSSV